MRIDKYLKVSRLVKRRPVAKEMLDAGRVQLNDKVVKAGTTVSIDDVIKIEYGNRIIEARVVKILDTTKKEEASNMYELIREEKKEQSLL